MLDKFFPVQENLYLESLEISDRIIIMDIGSMHAQATCPRCKVISERVHSSYSRRPSDAPWAGSIVKINLHLRRYFCDNANCKQRTFVERTPQFVTPYAHRTNRLIDFHREIGFSAGGEGGSRLASQLKMPISPDTILRLIRTTPDKENEPPRVVGIDDWAFRRGVKYGTIIIDLERHIPIDLLPDRTAETLEKWLVMHPSI